jgi:tRNA G37 N-methylase TrmD
MSGDHAAVARWRTGQARILTAQKISTAQQITTAQQISTTQQTATEPGGGDSAAPNDFPSL